MRYVGQGFPVDLAVPEALPARGDRSALRDACEAAYRALYGPTEAGTAAEVVSWRVTVTGPYPGLRPMPAPSGAGGAAGRFVEVPVCDRYRLHAGVEEPGPAIVEERESTLVVPAGARLSVDAHGTLIVDLAPDA